MFPICFILFIQQATDAKIKLGEMSGEKVSNTDRLKAIAEEQAVIESERDERREEEREEAEMKKNVRTRLLVGQ